MSQTSNSSNESIRDIIRRATDYYEHSIIPRAAVAGVPYIGGTIDRLLSGHAARRWQERITDMLEELKKNLNSIDENQVNKEYIQSAEFESLIIRIIQALQTAHEQEKVSYFANILTKAVITPSLQSENVQRYVMLVDELTGLHIRILRSFADRSKDKMRATEVAEITGGNWQEIQGYCSDLAAHGLLYDPLAGTLGWSPGSYRIHPSALPFIEFLSTSKSDDGT